MKHYGFLLLPEFSNLCLANSVEPLRAANSFITSDAYSWSLVSIDGEPVKSSSNFTVQVQSSLKDLLKNNPPDILLVLASYHYQTHTTQEVTKSLRLAKQNVPVIGGLDAGSYALAKAGLLEGYKATIHWAELETFSEDFPNILVKADRHIIDRNRITSGGAITALELMLALIRQDQGASISMAVSDLLIFDTEQPGSRQQRIDLPSPMEAKSPRLSRAIKAMEKNIESPMAMKDIAQASGISQRQMERDFKQILNTTANHHYLYLRVSAARRLITETSLSITEVAVRSGFNSLGSLIRSYKKFYACTPSQDRNNSYKK